MKILPDAMLTVTQACTTCEGTGIRDKSIVRCTQCHHVFSDEEIAADERAMDTWTRSEPGAPEPLMSCGHRWHHRQEDDECPRCRGEGEVTLIVSIRDLAETIGEILATKKDDR